MLECIFSVVVLLLMTFFTYMAFHIGAESDKGDYIPLPWEPDGFLYKLWSKAKQRKPFDKADIKYRDGDNT